MGKQTCGRSRNSHRGRRTPATFGSGVTRGRFAVGLHSGRGHRTGPRALDGATSRPAWPASDRTKSTATQRRPSDRDIAAMYGSSPYSRQPTHRDRGAAGDDGGNSPRGSSRLQAYQQRPPENQSADTSAASRPSVATLLRKAIPRLEPRLTQWG